eukprot:171352-Pyramimonas_sp.AAC.1
MEMGLACFRAPLYAPPTVTAPWYEFIALLYEFNNSYRLLGGEVRGRRAQPVNQEVHGHMIVVDTSRPLASPSTNDHNEARRPTMVN